MTLSGKGANDFFKMSGPDSLLRAGGITNFGQKFPPDSRLADWSRGCISKRANK